MNLYLISRPDDRTGGYDEYEGAVVAAEDEESARRIHPEGNTEWDDTGNYPRPSSWIPSDKVVATYLGIAKPYTKRGVIFSSFNAG